MKLKKIASLALTGVMAVSMLAGCGVNGSTNGNNATAPTSSIVDAVNNGQSSLNKVKVTFTANSKLEDAVKTVVAMYGDNVTADYSDAIAKYAAIVDPVTSVTKFYGNRAKDGKASTIGDTGNGVAPVTLPTDGETVTYYEVFSLSNSSASDAFLMNYAAKLVNELTAQLDDTTLVTEDDKAANKKWTVTVEGDTYYDFSYTGNVCMVEVPMSNGSTSYAMVVVINQTVAEKTLA